MPLEEPFVGAFRTGFVSSGHAIEPEQWRRAEMMWRFSRLVRLVSTQDYKLFKALYDIVYETDSDDIPRLFHERSMQERGKKLLAELVGDDEEDVDEDGEEEEDLAAKTKDPVELAITRKLVLMSEIFELCCGPAMHCMSFDVIKNDNQFDSN